MSYVVLICETNNTDKNIPADIVKSIKYPIQLIKCKFYNCKVIVSGILPRDFGAGIRRYKIRSVNLQIKHAVGEMNNNINVTYINPDHTWPTSGDTLSLHIQYKNNLHLIEQGNEKLAKAISTSLNIGGLKQH